MDAMIHFPPMAFLPVWLASRLNQLNKVNDTAIQQVDPAWYTGLLCSVFSQEIEIDIILVVLHSVQHSCIGCINVYSYVHRPKYKGIVWAFLSD